MYCVQAFVRAQLAAHCQEVVAPRIDGFLSLGQGRVYIVVLSQAGPEVSVIYEEDADLEFEDADRERGP